MEDHTLPIINKTKLLGTIITDDLKWNENTRKIVKQANQRLQILRKSSEFTSSLDEENKCDLERVQKNSCRIILGEKYINYQNSLKEIGL